MVIVRRKIETDEEGLDIAFKIYYCFTLFALAEPPVIIPLTLGSDVLNEGQFVQIFCTVTQGDEPLSIKWSLQGDIVSSEPELTTTALGTRTSMLTIQSVGYRHSGTYTCSASNKAGTRSQGVELRVNGEGRHRRRGAGMKLLIGHIFFSIQYGRCITFQNRHPLFHSVLDAK